jgi:hypothetical protein
MSPRASWLGANFSCSAAVMTRCLVSALSLPLPLSALDAVPSARRRL